MTTPNLTDSGQQAGAGAASASPSQPAGAQPNSADVAPTLEKRFDELQKQFTELQKSAQSKGDRATRRLEKQWDEYKPFLEKVKALGLNDEQIADLQKDLEFDQMKQRIQELSGEPLQDDTSGGPRKVDPALDAAGTSLKVLNKLGLSSNDPDVVQAIRENTDPDMLAAQLGGIAARRASTPQPTAAAMAAPASVTTRQEPGPEETQAKINRLAELQKSPTGHEKEMTQLEEALGWK